AEAMAKAKVSIHLSEYKDETSALATWHLPKAHYLEAWGDALAWDGSYTIVQPLIEPLHGGRSTIEVLSILAGEKTDGQSLVRATFAGAHGGALLSDKKWRKALHDGV